MQKFAKDSQTSTDWTQPMDLLEFANSYIHKLCACCVMDLVSFVARSHRDVPI